MRATSGCTKVSPGCDRCWAEAELKIRRNSPNPKIAAQWPGDFQGDVRLLPDNLEKILKERTPKAWSIWNDLFHKSVPFEYIDRVLAPFVLRPEQLAIILTKRIERVPEYFETLKQRVFEWDNGEGETEEYLITNALDVDDCDPQMETACRKWLDTWNARHLGFPLPNIWLGTSAEDQRRLEERAVHLLKCQASLLFLSLEPLLGEMNIKPYVHLRMRCAGDKGCGHTGPSYEYAGKKEGSYACPKCRENHSYFMTDSVGWVIVGGESRGGGIGRECRIEWVRSIVEQCKDAGVPVFVKQLHIDGKLVKDINKFPEDLRLRQVPVFSV